MLISELQINNPFLYKGHDAIVSIYRTTLVKYESLKSRGLEGRVCRVSLDSNSQCPVHADGPDGNLP